MKIAVSMYFVSDTLMLPIMVWVDTYFTQMIVMINMSPSLVDPLISRSVIHRETHGIIYSCMYLQSPPAR